MHIERASTEPPWFDDLRPMPLTRSRSAASRTSAGFSALPAPQAVGSAHPGPFRLKP
jgi:hypothetical protein